MTSYLTRLFEKHSRMLVEESGVAPDIIAGRGYRTAAKRSELPEDFKPYQRRPGLLIPVRSPSGASGHRLRPDHPRKGKDGKPRKYEQPADTPNMIDVHPRNMAAIRDASVDLWVAEGEKKADSLTSRGLCAVALFGVWGWCVPGTHGKELLPDFEHVALSGRRVYIVFDADVMIKEGVQLALERLVAALEKRGAHVLVVYLPGPEKGVDDFLVAGHTIAELKILARKFNPTDFARIRLSRDERLGALVKELWWDWYSRDWMRFVGKADKPNWARGHTARDTMEPLIELAARGGKVDGEGVVVRVGLRHLAELAAKSVPSIRKALAHLEADGQLEILPPEDEGKSRRYRLIVPRATLSQYGGRTVTEGEETPELQGCDPGVKGLRAPTAPRLRWSSPGRPRRREFELVPGRCVVRHAGSSPDPEDRQAKAFIKRIGPHRCAALDTLEAAGGEMHLEDLCEALHRKRPRDVRRRILKPLEEAGIIECEGDVIRLAGDWLSRLEEERGRKGEIEQAERERKKHREQSARYREHLARKKRGTPKASLDAVRRSKELREKRMNEIRDEEERDRAPTPPAIEVLISKIMSQHERIRLGLLCSIALEEGLRWRDVAPAVRRMGYRVEKLPEYGNGEFVYAGRAAA